MTKQTLYFAILFCIPFYFLTSCKKSNDSAANAPDTNINTYSFTLQMVNFPEEPYGESGLLIAAGAPDYFSSLTGNLFISDRIFTGYNVKVIDTLAQASVSSIDICFVPKYGRYYLCSPGSLAKLLPMNSLNGYYPVIINPLPGATGSSFSIINISSSQFMSMHNDDILKNYSPVDDTVLIATKPQLVNNNDYTTKNGLGKTLPPIAIAFQNTWGKKGVILLTNGHTCGVNCAHVNGTDFSFTATVKVQK